MSVQLHFSNFSSGELNPLIDARVDFEKYNKGARKLENVFVLPQGGLTNRFGTVFQGDLTTTASSQKLSILKYNDEFSYVIYIHNKILDVYLDGAKKASISCPYTDDEVPDIDYLQDGNELIIVHESFSPRILQRDTTDDTIWTLTEVSFKNKPTYDFARDYDDYVFAPSAKIGYQKTLTAYYIGGAENAGLFSVRHVGGIFEANNGLMRLTKLDTTDQMTGDIYDEFTSTENISGKDAYLAEPVFSDLRGWPKSVDIYQGRLFFGGTTQLPNGVFGSAALDAYNFDDSGATPADAISKIIRGGSENRIRYILDSKDLFLFTKDSEYSTPPFTDKPSSPENTYFLKQSSHGTANVKPVILDDKVIFIDKGGKIAWAMIYNVNAAKYQAHNVSILSSHLIKNPVSMATFKNPFVADADYLIVINEDGTLAIFLFIEDQEIAAWASGYTDGNFKQVVSSGSDVFFLVERTEAYGRTRLLLEKLSFETFLDSTTEFTFSPPQSEIEGLDHLEAHDIYVIGDGNFLGLKKVVSGKITLDEPVTTFQGGLPISWEVIPMPAQYQGNQGNNLYQKKRIKTIYLDYYQSLGVKINDKLIPDLRFIKDGFSGEVTPRSGVYEYANMGGWNKDEEVVISGDYPFEFNIRSITYGVDQ